MLPESFDFSSAQTTEAEVENIQVFPLIAVIIICGSLAVDIICVGIMLLCLRRRT